MIDSLATQNKAVIVISFGTPYLLSAFPSVSSYVLAWGGAPVSQRAAASALLGEAAISGRLPISIPPLLKFGDGLDRAAKPVPAAGAQVK
jgi:beta-N-acetylhexosaminidase